MFQVKCFYLLLSLLVHSQAQQCKTDQGVNVDWFFAYKPPALKNQNNMLLRKGLGYIYITSSNPSSGWKLSIKSINDSTSFFGQTLNPIYKDTSKKLLHIMYNDEPPTSTGSTIYGHAKGVVVTDGEVGMWLIHSSPKFPIEPISMKETNSTGAKKTMTVKNKYFFPSTALRFGQSFLCISLSANQMNKVGQALMYTRPKIYSSNVPESMEVKFFNLTQVARKQYITKSPWFKKFSLKSLGGKDFTVYTKTKEFNQDLYSGWLAEDLQSDLEVETWSNGPNELPSDCKGKYKVMDVKEIEIRTDEKYTLKFKNSQDHSKWAVTVNSNSTVVCIGDINRMLAQFKRGGGTVCYKHAFIWKKYANTVSELQPCSRSASFISELIKFLRLGFK